MRVWWILIGFDRVWGQRMSSPYSLAYRAGNRKSAMALRRGLDDGFTPAQLVGICALQRRSRYATPHEESSEAELEDCKRRIPRKRFECPQKFVFDSNDLEPPPINGVCHLVTQPGLGSTGSGMTRVFPRMAPNRFNPKTGRLPRTKQSLGTQCRINSNALTKARMPPNLRRTLQNRTALFTYITQFLDHDAFENPQLDELGVCSCGPNQPGFCRRVELPHGQQLFSPITGRPQGCMPLGDTQFCRDEDGEPTHLNQVTQWIDGSNIYGSSPQIAELLIDPDSPDRLRLSPDGFGSFFLPVADVSDTRCRNSPVCRCSIAGDVRSSENPGLAAVHVAYAALHNFVVDQININFAAQKLYVVDKKQVFDLARRIVIATWQTHVFQEINPLMLGNGLNNVLIKNAPILRGGNQDLVTLPLGAGMMRLHNLISINFSSGGGGPRPPFEATLSNAFLFALGGLSEIVRGMVGGNLDRQMLVPENMANRLNLTITQNMDLYASNCARSTLAGMPHFLRYQEFVKWSLPHRFRQYQQINVCPRLGLRKADVFSGSRCEFYPPGAVMGPTAAAFTAMWMQTNRRSRYFVENLSVYSPIREIAEMINIQATMCIPVKNNGVSIQPSPLTALGSSNQAQPCSYVVSTLINRLKPLFQRLVKDSERPSFVKVSPFGFEPCRQPEVKPREKDAENPHQNSKNLVTVVIERVPDSKSEENPQKKQPPAQSYEKPPHKPEDLGVQGAAELASLEAALRFGMVDTNGSPVAQSEPEPAGKGHKSQVPMNSLKAELKEKLEAAVNSESSPTSQPWTTPKPSKTRKDFTTTAYVISELSWR